MKVIDIYGPAAKRNTQADIVLHVALAIEGDESEALHQSKLQRRSGQTVEGRRLIVISVVAVQYPAQPRNANRAAQAGVECVFMNQAAVVLDAKAEIQRKPGVHFVLIFHEQRFRVGPMRFGLLENLASRVGRQPEKGMVMLPPGFKSRPRVVTFLLDLQDGADAQVVGARMIVQNVRRVGWAAQKLSLVGMEVRSQRENDTVRDAMAPIESEQVIAFQVEIANTGGLEILVIGNLVVVSAQGRNPAQLILGCGIVKQREESAGTRFLIVYGPRNGCGEAQVGSIGIDAAVVRKALGVTADTELIVG